MAPESRDERVARRIRHEQERRNREELRHQLEDGRSPGDIDYPDIREMEYPHE